MSAFKNTVCLFFIIVLIKFNNLNSKKVQKNFARNTYTETMSGSSLNSGDTLVSFDGNYKLTMQGDGNLVLYSCVGKALWSSSTSGSNYKFSVQTDGNLVIYSSTGNAKWSSQTNGDGTSPYQLKLQNDGNLVLYDSTGDALWSTGTSNATYACSTIQICATLDDSNDGAGTSKNARLYFRYNKGNDGYFACNIGSVFTKGETYCCNAEYLWEAESSDDYLDIYLPSTDDGILVTKIKTSDGESESRFYPGQLQWGAMLSGYLSGTCYKNVWIDQAGHGSCQNARIHFYSQFSSSNGSCAKVYCKTDG